MLMQIFFSRSHPAPDVTLRLVCVEDFAGLAGKGGVDLEEALGDVLMYRTLADPKLLCRLPHSRVVLYNIISNLHGSFLNIIFQKNPPANIVFTMYAGELQVMPLSFRQKIVFSAIFLIHFSLNQIFYRVFNLLFQLILIPNNNRYIM